MANRPASSAVDGVDEAAGLRDQIEEFVHKEVVPSGNRVLVTSRPGGMDMTRFEGFHKLSLQPLSEAQQVQAIHQRLGVDRAAGLLPYLKEKVPLDSTSNRRITDNPLMLSMVISIYEIRAGVNMPEV